MMKKLNKILLIDDDPINNFINKRILIKLDIADSVKVVKNGKEALDYIKEGCTDDEMICPELIIVDNHMPVMDGLEFMGHFNQQNFSNRGEVIVLALVATSTEEEVERFKKLGVNEITYKPLTENLIMEIYQRYWAMA
jgi:CheY-like chemotaxis protein